MANRRARIARQNVADLIVASADLAAFAALIQRHHPRYSDVAIKLLSSADPMTARIQKKGAAAHAQDLERHGLEEQPGDTEAAQRGAIAADRESTHRKGEE